MVCEIRITSVTVHNCTHFMFCSPSIHLTNQEVIIFFCYFITSTCRIYSNSIRIPMHNYHPFVKSPFYIDKQPNLYSEVCRETFTPCAVFDALGCVILTSIQLRHQCNNHNFLLRNSRPSGQNQFHPSYMFQSNLP